VDACRTLLKLDNLIPLFEVGQASRICDGLHLMIGLESRLTIWLLLHGLLVVAAKSINETCFAHILVQNRRQREGFAFGTYLLEFGQFVTPLNQKAQLTPDGVDVVGFPLLHQVQQDVLVVTIYKPLG
jgi:hypothetical protein